MVPDTASIVETISAQLTLTVEHMRTIVEHVDRLTARLEAIEQGLDVQAQRQEQLRDAIADVGADVRRLEGELRGEIEQLRQTADDAVRLGRRW